MPKAVRITPHPRDDGLYELEFDWELVVSADNYTHNLGIMTSTIELTAIDICDAIDEQSVETIYGWMEDQANEDARDAVSATASLESFDDEVLEELNPLEDDVCQEELTQDDDEEGLEVDF